MEIWGNSFSCISYVMSLAYFRVSPFVFSCVHSYESKSSDFCLFYYLCFPMFMSHSRKLPHFQPKFCINSTLAYSLC